MIFTYVAEEMAIPCSETSDQKHYRLHVLLWMVSLYQLTGEETEAQKVKAVSLICQAIAEFGLSIRETHAMQTDLFLLTLFVSLSAKLLFLVINLCVCRESYNKKMKSSKAITWCQL